MTSNSPLKNIPLKHVLKSEELYRAILKYQWLLLGIGIVVSLTASWMFPMHPDEKVFIDMADIIAAGGAPYRDMFDHKPPGIYLLLAPFVAIFGKNLAILRLIPFLLNIVIGWLLYSICRTIFKSREGVVVAFLYLILSPYYQANFILTEVPMTVCLLVGTLLALRYSQKLGRQEVFWVGFWLGLAINFKQTAFVYGLMTPFLLLYSLKGVSVRKIVWLLGLYCIGLILPIILMILYLISQNILAISYYQIIEYNIQSYSHYSISMMAYFIPQVLFPIVLLWVVARMFKKRRTFSTYYLYLLSSFIVASIPLLLFRPYHHYWIPVLPYVLLFL